MEKRIVPPIAPQSAALVTKKLPYAPPKATFIPLKLEERLLGCAKTVMETACVTGVSAS